MRSFLLSEYRSWGSVIEDPELEMQAVPLTQHSKGEIGFEYDLMSGPEREYHYAIMRWVALQVGKRRSRFRTFSATLSEPVSYLIFNGQETHPVLPESKWDWHRQPPSLRNSICDEYGTPIGDTVLTDLAWYHIPDGAYKRVTAMHHNGDLETIQESLVSAGLEGGRRTLKVIRSQVARLHALWV